MVSARAARRGAFQFARQIPCAIVLFGMILLTHSIARAEPCDPWNPCCYLEPCTVLCPSVCDPNCWQYSPCECCELWCRGVYCCDDKGTPDKSDDICTVKCSDDPGGCSKEGQICCASTPFYPHGSEHWAGKVCCDYVNG